MVTTTTSAACAASAGVAARARGPSSATRSAKVSGPRLLLSTTSCPAPTTSRARVLPMFPLPMRPHVVMAGDADGAPDHPGTVMAFRGTARVGVG